MLCYLLYTYMLPYSQYWWLLSSRHSPAPIVWYLDFSSENQRCLLVFSAKQRGKFAQHSKRTGLLTNIHYPKCPCKPLQCTLDLPGKKTSEKRKKKKKRCPVPWLLPPFLDSDRYSPENEGLSPENQWLEDVFLTKIVPFWGHVRFQGCTTSRTCWVAGRIIVRGHILIIAASRARRQRLDQVWCNKPQKHDYGWWKVDMVNIPSHCLQGLICTDRYISQVVQDFFHQQ